MWLSSFNLPDSLPVMTLHAYCKNATDYLDTCLSNATAFAEMLIAGSYLEKHTIHSEASFIYDNNFTHTYLCSQLLHTSQALPLFTKIKTHHSLIIIPVWTFAVAEHLFNNKSYHNNHARTQARTRTHNLPLMPISVLPLSATTEY